MTTAALPTLDVKMLPDGNRIALRADNPSPDLVEFFHSLPERKWNGLSKMWTCAPSPAAAWRIVRHGAQFASVSPDWSVAEMADRFAWGLDRASECANMELSQPEIRKTDAWRHQCVAYHRTWALDGQMLALGMGTGKSKVAVDAIVNHGCMATLIICPASVRAVWRREFAQHADIPPPILILEKGTIAKRTEHAKRYVDQRACLALPAIVVINYEAAWRTPFAAWALSREWDMVVLDESHRIKSHTSKISKFAAKLGWKAHRRLCLTGTPMAHSPLDLYGQYRFLEPGIFGTSWTAFSGRYAKRGNPNIPQQITGYQRQDELHARYKLLAYRVGKEVLDLPLFQHHDIPLTLGPAGRRAYSELENDLITDIGTGVVTVDNVLVKLLRLQQVTSGYLPEDDTKRIIEVGTEKKTALTDLLDGIDEPVIVFCKFWHDLDQARSVTKKLGRRYGEVSGRQKDLTDTAEMPAGIDVLGVQIQSGGVGIDLHRAAYAVYYSMGFSLGDYEQSLDRLHRPGQDRPVYYYHLVCEGTVDRRVYGALRQRKQVIEAVLHGLSKGATIA